MVGLCLACLCHRTPYFLYSRLPLYADYGPCVEYFGRDQSVNHEFVHSEHLSIVKYTNMNITLKWREKVIHRRYHILLFAFCNVQESFSSNTIERQTEEYGTQWNSAYIILITGIAFYHVLIAVCMVICLLAFVLLPALKSACSSLMTSPACSFSSSISVDVLTSGCYTNSIPVNVLTGVTPLPYLLMSWLVLHHFHTCWCPDWCCTTSIPADVLTGAAPLPYLLMSWLVLHHFHTCWCPDWCYTTSIPVNVLIGAAPLPYLLMSWLVLHHFHTCWCPDWCYTTTIPVNVLTGAAPLPYLLMSWLVLHHFHTC